MSAIMDVWDQCRRIAISNRNKRYYKRGAHPAPLSEHDLDDITQEAFLRVWQRFTATDGYDTDEAFDKLCFYCTRSAVTDWMKERMPLPAQAELHEREMGESTERDYGKPDSESGRWLPLWLIPSTDEMVDTATELAHSYNPIGDGANISEVARRLDLSTTTIRRRLKVLASELALFDPEVDARV